MTHPHIPPTILLLPLNATQHCRHTTFTSRRIPRLKTFPVMAVGDIDPFIPSNRMGIDGGSRMDAVLPFLLHLRMHHQKRIVGQMDCYLTFSICSLILRACGVVIISSDNLADSKLSGDTKTQATNDCSWSEIRELIRVVTYAFASSGVAICESRVWYPLFWRLVFELLAIRVVRLDSFGDLLIYSSLHFGRDHAHLRLNLPHILLGISIISIGIEQCRRYTVKKLPLYKYSVFCLVISSKLST